MAAPEAAAKRPKGTLIAVGAVVVFLAAYFLVLKPKPTATPTTPPAVAAVVGGSASVGDLDQIPRDGPVVALDSITVNLADGNFLRVGVALQLSKAAAKSGSLDTKTFGAPALDATISVMSTYTTAELTSAKGRSEAKAQLTRAIAARYPGEVLGLYFTDFVMQ